MTEEEMRYTGENSVAELYFKMYQQCLKNKPTAEETADGPFLSVLMRTQGKRRETLKEAFLSLQAQSDQDFEIILIMHRTSEEDKQTTLQLIEELSPEIKSKLSYYFLETGGRAAPLNLALSKAKGHYFTMLDDDDIVLDHWVENFHKGAEGRDGVVIRAYAVTQLWESHIVDGKTVLMSSDSPKPAYCQPFDLKKQLYDNYTPISCVAIPRTCYSVFGFTFDESLNTAEDWDFIMRCIMFASVYDTREITFLYRLWMNVESSRTLYQQEEWLKNRDYIIEKFNRMPILTTRSVLLPEEEEQPAEIVMPLPPLPFWPRLRRAIRNHGIRLPLIAIKKIYRSIFP